MEDWVFINELYGHLEETSGFILCIGIITMRKRMRSLENKKKIENSEYLLKPGFLLFLSFLEVHTLFPKGLFQLYQRLLKLYQRLLL